MEKGRDVGGGGTGQGHSKGRLGPGDHDSSFTTFIILISYRGSGHSKALKSPQAINGNTGTFGAKGILGVSLSQLSQSEMA